MNHVSTFSISRLGARFLTRRVSYLSGTRFHSTNSESVALEWSPQEDVPSHSPRSPSPPARKLKLDGDSPRPLPPEPQTSDQLYRNLVALIEGKPPYYVPQLVAYHDKFPSLQNTESFNLLLEHAIYHHDRGHSLLLSRQLNSSSSCKPNDITLRLWIRFLAELGGGQEAWTSLVQSTPSPTIDALSPDVWKEFLRMARLQKVPRAFANSPENLLSTVGPGPLFIRFIDTALQRDTAAADKLHFLRMLIARLVKEGFIPHAAAIIERLLREAPLDIPQRHQELLLEIIHQFLAFGPKATASHFEMRKFLNNLVTIRPSLRYDSQTLLLLLRSLARTKNPGWQGYQLLRIWLERWGPSSETDSVLLRIAGYAFRDRRDDIATVMLSRRGRIKSEPRSNRAPLAGASRHGIARRRMQQVYTLSGQRQVMWQIIAGRCKQATKSRSDDSGLSAVKFQQNVTRLNRRLEIAIKTWGKQ